MTIAAVDIRARSDEPGQRVELYDLDLGVRGGPVIYFHPYTELTTGQLVWQGHPYDMFPITSEGWGTDSRGGFPHPTLSVANIDSVVTSLMRQYDDFIGCKITRHQTYVEFLDVMPNGDPNPGADPLQEFPPEIFYVNRKLAESSTVVQFELAAPNDVKNIMLPGRQITGTFCAWDYRSVECTYHDAVGPPVADENNKPFTDENDDPLTLDEDRGEHNPLTTYGLGDYVWVLVGEVGEEVRVYYVSRAGGNTEPLTNKDKWVRDTCSRTIHGCRLRFSPTGTGFGDGILPFGDFPGASKIPSI